MRTRKGQSTLEYVIILTAIIAAIIVGAKAMQTKVGDQITTVAGKMNTEVGNITFGANPSN